MQTTDTVRDTPDIAAVIAQRRSFNDAAFILRQKWGIQEPELGKIPRWLRPLISAACKRKAILSPLYTLDPFGALYHAANACGGHSWIDRVGRLKLAGGEQVLISEPYQLLDQGKEQLERFCSTLGLTYTVQDESWWYPGRTVRIVVSQPEGLKR